MLSLQRGALPHRLNYNTAQKHATVVHGVIITPMKSRLSRIEARLQSIFEGGAARVLPFKKQQESLSKRLLEALRLGVRIAPGGEAVAPNLYTLVVHPSLASGLQENQAFLGNLVQTLKEAADESGYVFSSPPAIRVEGDPLLSERDIQVLAEDSHEKLTDTSDYEAGHPQTQEAVPEGAFLIVDGTRIEALEQPVINVGRRLDNQLVVEDSRVSRVHAQLRAIKGRYVIFDLDSTGGTFVNGEPVQQHVLHPGDVISLAGVPMVYGQDSPVLTDTQDWMHNPPGRDSRR